MGRNKHPNAPTNEFEANLILNTHSYRYYFNKLFELAISMFEWKNLPPSVNRRYLELELFETGCMVYFQDDVMGDLCLNCLYNGRLDVYGDPVLRRAYSRYNNYQKLLKPSNSVVIWNNYLHLPSYSDTKMFASKLYLIDRTIDVNVHAQKTPVALVGSEQQRLTLLNLYKQYAGNEPFIFGDKNLDLNALTVLKTDAPFISDKLYTLKTQYWNEALTHLGISNINIQKKERLITDEVTRNQGGTIASRYSRLESRREAVEKINDMFDLNIEVNYREDFQQVDDDTIPEEAGADTIGGVGNE